jgi:hypothetical protein
MLLATHPIPTLEVSARIVNPDDPFSEPSECRIRHTVVRKKLQSNRRCSIYTHTVECFADNKRCSIYTHTVECFADPDEPDTPTQTLQFTSRAHVQFDPFTRLEALLRQTRYKRLRWVKRRPAPPDNPPPVNPNHA